jgi:NTE family protein
MALPGLFSPVEIDGRVLIDGGTTNPLPYDLLTDSCDIVIAIDINSGGLVETGVAPGTFSTLFGSIRIMQQTIVEKQLRASQPDIYIRPDLGEIRTLQFHKADVIYRQAAPAKEQLKHDLARVLERP